MSLVERLEKLAKELDQQRWHEGKYDADKADQSDLVAEAAKELRIRPYIFGIDWGVENRHGNP